MMNQFQSPFKIKKEEFEFSYALKGKWLNQMTQISFKFSVVIHN